MKSYIKQKKLIILLAVPTILTGLYYGSVFYYFAQFVLPLDFTQNYRAVQGIENIVFWENWDNQCYQRCFWGLKKTEHMDPTDTLYASDASLDKLRESVEIEHTIHQSIYSPDQNYILYCEIEYNYGNSGMTDDEYCYYKVYEVETGKIIPVFQGYRKWYWLFWQE